MQYLSVAACFKNEAPYLREWIEFHRMVGVQEFYLYDNASTDSPQPILEPYLDAGIVHLSHTDMDRCQTACYVNALDLARGRWRWMAFIDLDEFLFCPDGRDLKVFLQEFESYPAVGAGWLCFGSSGHRGRPQGLVTENFTGCSLPTFEPNRHIKSICCPGQTLCPAFTPHNFVHYNTQGVPVDENCVPLEGPFRNHATPYTVDRIRINHYITRSYEEWEIKRSKGRADCSYEDKQFIRPDSHFTQFDRNERHDVAIHRYLPQLKARLGMA